MSIIRTATRIMVGAAAGLAAAAAVNPEIRREIAVKALRVFEEVLKRAGGAMEAGRYAAQMKEKELERLLEGEPVRVPKSGEGLDYIV